MASSAWLVITMSASAARARARSAKQSSPKVHRTAPMHSRELTDTCAPHPVVHAGHQVVAVARLGLRGPGPGPDDLAPHRRGRRVVEQHVALVGPAAVQPIEADVVAAPLEDREGRAPPQQRLGRVRERAAGRDGSAGTATPAWRSRRPPCGRAGARGRGRPATCPCPCPPGRAGARGAASPPGRPRPSRPGRDVRSRRDRRRRRRAAAGTDGRAGIARDYPAGRTPGPRRRGGTTSSPARLLAACRAYRAGRRPGAPPEVRIGARSRPRGPRRTRPARPPAAGETRACSRVPVPVCSSPRMSPAVVHPRHEVTAVVGQQHVDLDVGPRQLRLHRGQQLRDALPAARGDDDRGRLAPHDPLDDVRVGGVRLVDHDHLRHPGRVDLGEHGAYRGQLRLRLGIGAVDDVQDQVGPGDLLQRRPERLDQLVRQVPHEADRVGERVVAPVRASSRGGPSGRAWRTARSPPAPRRR